GDAERMRLERDLHDGAQQRLVGLALSLRLLRTEARPEVEASLDTAEGQLREAIAELRKLAHGIFPTVLADAGLGAGLGRPAEESTVPIRYDGLLQERYPPSVETAAYLVVSEAAGTAADGLVVHTGRVRDALV